MVTLVIVGEYRAGPVVAAAATAASMSPDNSAESSNSAEPIPVKTRPKKKSNGEMKAGYYVLEQNNGEIPKYVYYGDKPPTPPELEGDV